MIGVIYYIGSSLLIWFYNNQLKTVLRPKNNSIVWLKLLHSSGFQVSIVYHLLKIFDFFQLSTVKDVTKTLSLVFTTRTAQV